MNQTTTKEPQKLVHLRDMLGNRKYDASSDEQCAELHAILGIKSENDKKRAKVIREEVIAMLEKAANTKSIVKPKYKQLYGKAGHCGDEVALAMKEALDNGHTLESIAEANGLDFNRWINCNYGQQRMSVSNVLRGNIRRKEKAIIGDKEYFAG